MRDYSFLGNIYNAQDFPFRPYPLRPGAEDPILSSFLDEVPDIIHSPSGSSDLSELSDQERAVPEAYDPSVDPPVDDGKAPYSQTNEDWFNYLESLKIDKPHIFADANVVRAQAEKKGLIEYSYSPPLALSKRRRGRRPSSSCSRFADLDIHGETDDDTGSEYLPSPGLIKRKRIRLPSPTTTTCTSVSSDHVPSSSRKRRINKSHEQSDSRNKKARPEEWGGIRVAIERDTPKNGQCSYCGKKISTRAPDVRRHMKTHLPREVKCIGIPLNESSRFLIPANAKMYLYNGEPYIGGCMQLFSRSDALKRHLDNCNLGCVSSRKTSGTSNRR